MKALLRNISSGRQGKRVKSFFSGALFLVFAVNLVCCGPAVCQIDMGGQQSLSPIQAAQGASQKPCHGEKNPTQTPSEEECPNCASRPVVYKQDIRSLEILPQIEIIVFNILVQPLTQEAEKIVSHVALLENAEPPPIRIHLYLETLLN